MITPQKSELYKAFTIGETLGSPITLKSVQTKADKLDELHQRAYIDKGELRPRLLKLPNHDCKGNACADCNPHE